jgi:hypothetical protein
MGEEDKPGENQERHTKSMGKRIGVVLLIAAVFLAAGLWIYRRHEAHRTMRNASPARVEPSRTPPPAGGAAAGGHVEIGPPPSKGVVSEAPAFSPRSGEVLDFAANITKLNSTVANLKVKVGEHRSLAGKKALHLQAFAHTENPYRMVFELDDQFDSYSDVPNFTSLQYEMHLSERGQKVDTIERMLSSGKEPAPPDAVAARVLPGTRDPIGMLMYLRGVDWNKTTEVRSPVFDGHKLYDVRAVLLAKSQNVSVTAGEFTATKIEIHVLDNGTEMKDAHFLLYIAEGPERLPVLMEAVLPVATARVELVKAH